MIKEKKAPLISPILRWFLFAMVLANISSQMTFTLLPLYMKDLGATVAQVGIAFTIASLVPLALQILGGWISDTIGRLKTVAFGSIAGVIGSIILWLAPTWQASMFALMVTFIAVSMVSPSFSSFIADQSSEENRGKVYGISSAIYMVIGVIGPPLGGYLVKNHGYKFMLLIALLLYAFAALLRIWMAFSTKLNTDQKQAEPLKFSSLKANLGSMIGLIAAGGIVTWILISDGMADINFRLIGSLVPLYQEGVGGLNVEQIGLLAAINSIVMIALMIPSGWLSDKLGERVGISLGFVFISAAIWVYLPAQTFGRYIIAWVLFGIGQSISNPAYQSLVSKAIPEKIRGTAFGFFQSSLGLISLPAPYIGAWLWERYSPQTPFQITAIGAIVLAVFAWFKLVLPKDGNEDIVAAEAAPVSGD
jgi:MFS family permease